jgi:hypothetical protein
MTAISRDAGTKSQPEHHESLWSKLSPIPRIAAAAFKGRVDRASIRTPVSRRAVDPARRRQRRRPTNHFRLGSYIWLAHGALGSNQGRHCERPPGFWSRGEAIQGMKGRSGGSGSPRRFAPSGDDCIRTHLALVLLSQKVTGSRVVDSRSLSEGIGRARLGWIVGRRNGLGLMSMVL